MKIAIAGTGASGKTTLFSSFTGTAPASGQGKSVMGVVNVPDLRLERLSSMFNPRKTVYATVDFVDTAPLDSQNKQEIIPLFDTLKTSDALVCVVGVYRCLTAEEALEEFKKVRLDILINDLDMAVKRAERLEKEIKIAKNKAEKQKELELIGKIQPLLERETFLYGIEFDEEEKAVLHNFGLLSVKPCVYVLNRGDAFTEAQMELLETSVKNLLSQAGDPSPVISLNAGIESEIALMDEEEKTEFLAEYGIEEFGRDRVIRAAFERLSLITFFTVGEDECRAWKVREHATAVDAAGVIHSDLARGFIRAEVIDYGTLLELGSLQEAKKAGKLRLEGKTYRVRDGDILHVMFNV